MINTWRFLRTLFIASAVCSAWCAEVGAQTAPATASPTAAPAVGRPGQKGVQPRGKPRAPVPKKATGSCDELFTTTDAYVVLFDADKKSFRSRNASLLNGGDIRPLPGQEVIVCVDSKDLRSRYRLVFSDSTTGGETTLGTMTVGFAPRATGGTSLQAAQAGLPEEDEDESLSAALRDCDTDECKELAKQTLVLLDVGRRVVDIRNSLSQLLVDVTSRPMTKRDLVALQSVPAVMCSKVNGAAATGSTSAKPKAERGVYFDFPVRTVDKGFPSYTAEDYCKDESGGRAAYGVSAESFVDSILSRGIRVVNGYWRVYGTPTEPVESTATGEPEPPPPGRHLDPYGFWKQAEQWVQDRTPAEASSPPIESVGSGKRSPAPAKTADQEAATAAATKRLRAQRLEMIGVLDDALKGYQRLASLASMMAGDVGHGTRVFRLGSFDANKAISATLEEYSTRVRYDEQQTSLEYDTPLTAHALGFVVPSTSWWHLQIGVALSSLRDNAFELETRGEGADADRFIVQTRDEPTWGAATFAHIFWCEQDLSRSIYDRSCIGGHDYRRYIPGVAIGLPLSEDLVKGHVFLGFSLPYIPYVGVTGGLHVGEELVLRERVTNGMDDPDAFGGVETTAESISDAVDSSRRIGWFIALTLTSDLLKALFPQSTPAQ